MAELRRRPASVRGNTAEREEPREATATADADADAVAAATTAAAAPPAKKSGGCPVQIKSGTYYYVRKAVVILFPAYILCCMFEVLEPPRPMAEHTWDAIMEALGKGPRVFTAAELKEKGAGSRRMLSILGEVFDVSKGRKHYGKGGAYEGFTGRDATRAFVSGDFTEAGLTDDLSGLEPSKCLGIQDWHTFYVDEDKYVKRGVLAGRFYDTKGKPTRELTKFYKCAREGLKEKEREAAEKKMYPSCNSRWAAAEGGRVWCADEKKVPRKFAPKTVHGSEIRQRDGGGGGDAEETRDARKAKGRCSCFDLDYAIANEDRLLSYGGCPPNSNSCVTKPPEAPKPKARK